MAHEYAAVQQKTFTRWINDRLLTQQATSKYQVNDLLVDLDSGIILCVLLEVLQKAKINYNKKPRWPMSKRENINAALNFAKMHAINLVNIGAGDIVEGNQKIILGLIWRFILRYQFAETGDNGLLLWVQERIKPYGLTVNSFNAGWTDGKILTALTHSLAHGADPATCNLENLEPLLATEVAMDKAHDDYGIPKMMDAKDMVEQPDPHSIMTYISYFVANAEAQPSDGDECVLPGENGALPLQFGEYMITVSCRNLIKMDEFTKSDPVVGLFANTILNGTPFLGKTEWQANNHDPDFKTMLYANKEDDTQSLVFKCYDMSTSGIKETDLIGSVKFDKFNDVTEEGITITEPLVIEDEKQQAELTEAGSVMILNIKRLSKGKLMLYNLFKPNSIDDNIWYHYDEHNPDLKQAEGITIRFDPMKDELSWFSPVSHNMSRRQTELSRSTARESSEKKILGTLDVSKVYEILVGKISPIFHLEFASHADNEQVLTLVAKTDLLHPIRFSIQGESNYLREQLVDGVSTLLETPFKLQRMTIVTSMHNQPEE